MPDISMNSLYTESVKLLGRTFPQGEARALVRILLEDAFGVGINDVYADKVRQFSPSELQKFHSMLLRLANHEPVQYVVGRAKFGNLTLDVNNAVLIPRPETLELAQWASEQCSAGAEILDLGTGSGCLAIYLALAVENSQVTAVDISSGALATARANAAKHSAAVNFLNADMLSLTFDPARKFSLIVSNPPYVCESERADMERNVLDHEPPTALFVPDGDALRFYTAVARIAKAHLLPGGAVMVEINRRFPAQTAEIFSQAGFRDIEIRNDFQGNARMIKAVQR